MAMCRREFLGGAGLLALAANSPPAFAQSATTYPLPDPSQFESGDLVWPKIPGAYVPYRSTGQMSVSIDSDRNNWERERAAFLSSTSSAQTGGAYELLARIDFREFYARYAGDQHPDTPGVYASGRGVYVGHVGIIEIGDDDVPWVIEAVYGRGVIRSRYDQWLAARPDIVVWQGRVRDLDQPSRSSIALEAKKYVGRPYDFWNFDLNDDASFYCSKLVWLSIFRSFGFAIDGDSNPERAFWFSPKQLLYLDTISRLHDPGPYAFL